MATKLYVGNLSFDATEDDVWGVTPDEGYVDQYDRLESINLQIRFSHLDALAEQVHTPEEDQQESAFVDRQLEKSLEYIRTRLGVAPVAAPASEDNVPADATPDDATPAEVDG